MYLFGFVTNRILVKSVDFQDLLCPHCAKKGQLAMKFFQLEQDGAFRQRLNKLEPKVDCKSCGQSFTEQQFTPELKQLFDNEKKNIKLVTSIKLGTLGKRALVVLFGCIAVAAGIFMANSFGLLNNSSKNSVETELENTKQYVANPQIGDICKTLITRNGQVISTLYKIIEMDKPANKIVAAPHFEQGANANWDSFSLADDKFDKANKLAFSLKDFSTNRLVKDGEKPNEITRSIYSIVRQK